jgi:ribosome biogenesis GTPase / thiamine phosphate phosphatase
MTDGGHPLERYGWDGRWAALAPPGALVGRITRVDRGECDVVTAEGPIRVASDSTRAQGEVAPAVGDWVVVADGPDDMPAIDAVLPRRSVLVRRDPSEAIVDQVLVANIDTVLLVHGLDRPLPPGRLERFLVQAWDSGAELLVVATKSDLVASTDEVRATVAAVAPGVPVIEVSSVTGTGVEDVLRAVPPGTTAAMLGASGAGKSTLVNLLVGHELQPTTAVRGSDARGRHTTTARALVPVPGGGMLIDTPGVRSVGVWADEEALRRVFADIDDLAGACRFADCLHDREPDCAVRDAVDPRRLERYRALLAEIREMHERERRRSRPKQGRR